MNPGDMNEDVLETRLRRALNAEATMVEPSGDGLGRIRAGIDAQRYDVWWRRPAVALVAAALIGLAVGGAAVALNQDDDGTKGNLPANQTDQPDTTTPEPTTEPSVTSAAPTTTPPSTTAGGASRVTVPVYYLQEAVVGDLRLYREFHAVTTPPRDAVKAALREMFGGQAVDPDYDSAWPADTKVLSVSRSGSTATVDLSKFPSVGSDAETKSVQQLVYTVTATDKNVKQVRLLVNGKTPPSGVSDWSQPVARAPMLDVQGLIWILKPTEGAKAGSPVKVTVYGTAYEGNVILKVYRGASFDQEVASTFVTTAMGEFREASTTIELDPGTYAIRAFDENAENGELMERDGKTFTVR
jgi:hypothetical protein